MKFLNYVLSLAIIASIALLTSCGGDDPKPKTKKEILSASAWKISRIKVGTTEGDPADCYADNTDTYEASGTYKYEAGSVKCDPDETSYTGTWELKTDDTKLVTSETAAGVTFSLNYTVLELTETKMRLKWDFVTDQSVEVTYVPK